MFYYIDQPHTTSFLLKLNLILLLDQVRLTWGDECWWKPWLVSMLIIFLAFRPDLSPWGYRNRCVLVALCRMIVMRPNLEVVPKRLLDQQVKILGVVLVRCCLWKTVPTGISGGMDISEVPECNLSRQMICQWGLQKLLQGFVSHELTAYPSVFNMFLTQWILYIIKRM